MKGMKKIYCWLLCLLFVATATAQQRGLKQLLGRWESADGEGIELVDSTRLFLLYHGEKKLVSDYQIDFTRSPYWFDFTLKDSSGIHQIKSLLLVVNDDLLQWQIFEDFRPSEFDPSKGEMIYLKRRR
jgi:hypothetical protein